MMEAGDMEIWDRALRITPKMFTALSISETPDVAFPGMIPQLTDPLMAICMEDTDSKYDPWHPLWQEVPLQGASVNLTANIIENANSPVYRQLCHDEINYCQCIELLLPRRPHIAPDDDLIMATNTCHHASV
jgi:hypothetical protein